MTSPKITFNKRLNKDGFVIIPEMLDISTMERLKNEINNANVGQAVRQRRGATIAIRNLFDVYPTVRNLVSSAEVSNLIESVLGKNAFVVRAILFDKTPEANWKVAWHQDVSIAVKQRIETPGFGPWSTKAGIMHVRPPAKVLEDMLTIRIHLDNCDESNGALQVIPGSHLKGFLDDDSLKACRGRDDIKLCCVPAGGAVLMRPLIAHASSPGTNPSRRRVIHLEYCIAPLPGELQWHRA